MEQAWVPPPVEEVGEPVAKKRGGRERVIDESISKDEGVEEKEGFHTHVVEVAVVLAAGLEQGEEEVEAWTAGPRQR